MLQPICQDEYISDVVGRLEEEEQQRNLALRTGRMIKTVAPLDSTPTVVSKYNIVFKRISWHFPLVRLDNKLFVDVMFHQVRLYWQSLGLVC